MPSTTKGSAQNSSVINSANSLGLFSAPGYISIGDEYEKKRNIPDRCKGKQITTSSPKKGKVGKGATFEEFKPLYQNEKYVDAGVVEKQFEKEKQKHQLHGPFKPSSPTKKSTGLGMHYGTLGKTYEHLADYQVPSKNDKPPEVIHEKPNILTSPPKKGGFGFSRITIGKDYQYESDPYDTKKLREVADKKEQDGKAISQKPFKSTCTGMEYFDSHPHVAAQKILTVDKLAPETKKKSASPLKNSSSKPFIPSSPPKNGYNCTISKFPEYSSDLYDKDSVSAEKAKEKRNSHEAKPIWKSTSASHSMPCKSILFESKC